MSMTSLIDVIFLLLLFFMLSSSFTRFAEVDLTTAGGGGVAMAEARPVFLRLGPEGVSVNGVEAGLDGVPGALGALSGESGEMPVIVAMRGAVTAQRLTDLLVVLRGVPGLRVTVLEAG
ncbi:biopolymer transporter ExbD [Aquicoccus porphyridii]|nr:biopolymer transporter ExbD [Aquicoccus porphyridii]